MLVNGEGGQRPLQRALTSASSWSRGAEEQRSSSSTSASAVGSSMSAGPGAGPGPGRAQTSHAAVYMKQSAAGASRQAVPSGSSTSSTSGSRERPWTPSMGGGFSFAAGVSSRLPYLRAYNLANRAYIHSSSPAAGSLRHARLHIRVQIRVLVLARRAASSGRRTSCSTSPISRCKLLNADIRACSCRGIQSARLAQQNSASSGGAQPPGGRQEPFAALEVGEGGDVKRVRCQ